MEKTRANQQDWNVPRVAPGALKPSHLGHNLTGNGKGHFPEPWKQSNTTRVTLEKANDLFILLSVLEDF